MEKQELAQIRQQLLDAGFDRAAPVSGDMIDMSPAQEVRGMCKLNYCGKFGKTWSCPPGCGEIGDCAARILSYDQGGILVQKVYPMVDSYDFEGAQEGQKDFNTRFAAQTQILREKYPDMLPLGAGTCQNCETCTYPDQPCRHPDALIYSMESQGILVSTLCKKCGVPYISGVNTVTYIGLLLFR